MTAREIVYNVLMVIARRQGFILSRDVENACIETDLGLIDTEWISSHIIQEDIPILDEEPERHGTLGDRKHKDEPKDIPPVVTNKPSIQSTGRSSGAIPDGIYYYRGKGFSYEARMEAESDNYILLKGSRIKRSGGASLRKKLQQIRNSPMYIKDYVVIQDGNGLFIVKQGNNTYYTRDGAFEFDAVGDYVLPGSGLHVQGWLREADGTIDTSDETKITDIVVPNGQTIDARQTTTASLTGNLNASSATGTTLTTMVEVYASQGQHYSIPVVFKKTGTNAWSYKIQDNWKAKDGTTATLAGTLSFDGDGKSTGTTTSTLTVKLTNGATTPITITLDTSKLTQVSAESTEHVEQDGYGAGKLLNISIDNQGIITGTYSNGVKRQEAQIAIAQFPNATGLTKSGNNLYQISNNSGSRTVGTNSALGVTITPSALEMSNTDIANEFADMIITQRGFQSNSKIITVGDEMLETLINMKR